MLLAILSILICYYTFSFYIYYNSYKCFKSSSLDYNNVENQKKS